MAISRDTRIDRRRRVLRDAYLNESDPEAASRGGSSPNSSNAGSYSSEMGDNTTGKRTAGYSHNVRRACGTRLVQFIPVRTLSFAVVVAASILATSLLLAVHYLIYVSGNLDWYGHPLAVAFDATHPQSIAAWLGSHLWLLCLVSTILTFQLRRHKLDDYKGEYRLWFWLVITCLFASVNSTTQLSELLGYSLDRWSQLNLGWSGRSVVHATLAVLIGLLGIRLCSELKAEPTSLIFWLAGLTAWAGSGALAEEIFRIDISLQMRYWLRAATWLGGLTFVWIASLAYLRHVYMRAQQRFLLRGSRARRTNGPTLTQRLGKSAQFFRRKRQDNPDQDQSSYQAQPRRKKMAPAAVTPTEIAKPAGPLASIRAASATRQLTQNHSSAPVDLSKERTKLTGAISRGDHDSGKALVSEKKRWKFQLWPGKNAPEEPAEEYRKVSRPSPTVEKTSTASSKTEKPKREKKQGRRPWKTVLTSPFRAVGSGVRKFKFPSLGGLKLAPPEPERPSEKKDSAAIAGGPRPVAHDRQLPGTGRSASEEEMLSDDRHLSRAERKRLKRQNRAA